MNILICDDEKPTADRLFSLIDAHLREKQIEPSVDVFTCSRDALRQEKSYDMAFLDVEIDETDGTQIAVKLKKRNRHIILFIITSYDKYLDSAMDLNVFRFITKPVEEKRLFDSIDRALERMDRMIIPFYLKTSREIVRICSQDILYVEVDGHGTAVVTEAGRYPSPEKIGFWKEKLSSRLFYSPHNSYLINLNFVTDFRTDHVCLAGRYPVPIAYRKRAGFRKLFMSFISERG